MEPDQLLEGLNDDQRRAVTSEAQPLCVLAGAGSGKTRVLTRRIAWRAATGTLEPNHVMALTFTRKAADELNERVAGLGLRKAVTAGTFHSVAYAQLRTLWADRGTRPPTLLDRKAGFVARLMSEELARATSPFEIAAEIEWAKARLVSPDAYVQEAARAGRRPPVDGSVVADLYSRYEEQKARRNVVDFDDLLRLCDEAIRQDRELATTQRWRFRHFFVDEFQDVNAAQYRLLQAWLGDRADLCVVGDPRQAIYSWNGADASYLDALASDGSGAEVVRLSDNYRSTPEILSAANRVIGGRQGLRSNRSGGPEPTLRQAPDDLAEAAAVARAARDRHGDLGRWSAQAVLVRTHAQANLIAEALAKASIPHRLRVEHRSGPLDPGGSADAGRGFSVTSIEGRGGPGGPGDAVEVVTFHAAKGLEWPVVHVAGLEQGLVPIGHARTPAALAEERRLLYVALTRARDELHCTWAEQRTFSGRTVAREPSMFLDHLQSKTGGPGTRGKPAELTRLRRQLEASRASARS